MKIPEEPLRLDPRSLREVPAHAAIALGANLGNRRATLDRAVEGLAELGTLLARSSWHETEPEHGADQPRYLNGALVLETRLSPHALLDALLAVEARHGRRREQAIHERRAEKPSRTLDLDLLLYDDEIVHTPELELPHPRMHQRRFVLAPLSEIAPRWRHPTLGKTVAELLALLPADHPP